jgi:hypothetical protein
MEEEMGSNPYSFTNFLGVDSIPVVLEKNQSGFSVIKGEKHIKIISITLNPFRRSGQNPARPFQGTVFFWLT